MELRWKLFEGLYNNGLDLENIILMLIVMFRRMIKFYNCILNKI